MLVSEGIEIGQGCQLISSLVGALGKLPDGVGRFLPCRVGSHMSRLRHLGWEHCSHGLTSRPLESCHHQCLKAVCGIFGYPAGAAAAAAELLDGTLKLRYCNTVFTKRFPSGFYQGRIGKRGAVTSDHLLNRKTPRYSRPWWSGSGASDTEAMEMIASPSLLRTRR